MALRTDLAVELRESAGELKGVTQTERSRGKVKVVEVEIATDEGAKALGRSKGRYITIETHVVSKGDRGGEKEAAEALAYELRALAGAARKGGTLVVGLGNRMVTADSLGPAVCDKIFVTRHIRELAPEALDKRLNDVCAISPGVLGVTGVETYEIIEGVVKRVSPALVIAIDSLASRSVSRIRTTFQLSNTGIAPGSGIGNKRKALNEETLGIPVIALGVPLVVYASTIAEDLLRGALNIPEGASNPDVDRLVRSVSETEGAELVVTPKDIDFIVEACARVISDAINLGLHDNITLNEVVSLMTS